MIRKFSRPLIIIAMTCSWAMLYGQAPGKIESALSCKKCHEKVYDQWSSSQHARSTPVNNVLFAKIYELSQKDTDGQTKLYCIRCHAPVTQTNGDVDLLQEITNEGVTCDVCHSITQLSDHPGSWPNVYEPGEVKRSARRDVEPEGHKSAYSEIFENGKICSGCHGDMLDIPGTRSCGDLTICDTDFEWQGTTFAREGKSCVACHMTGVVEKSFFRAEKSIIQHDFPGAYSPAKLQAAAKLSLDIKEFEGEVIARVEIVNDGVAHLLPTGPPARLVFLKVSALDQNDREIWSNFESNQAVEDPFGIFHIVFADQNGKVPSMPWLAVRIVKDTRLRPGETRRLIYKFPGEGVAKVTAKLYYRLAPPPLLDKFEIVDETLRTPYLMADEARSIGAE